MATSDRISELFAAIERSDIEQVDELLTSEISLEQKNADGQTPLNLASIIGKFEVIELLLSAGAKVNLEKEALVFNPFISSIELPTGDDLSELIALATEDGSEEVKNFYSDLLSVVDNLSENPSNKELDEEDQQALHLER